MVPRNPQAVPVRGRRRETAGFHFTLIAAAVWSCGLATLGILRHLSFHSNAYDLGLKQHVVWNTAHGRWFEYSYMVAFPPHLTNSLGDHVNLILLPIALLYWLYDGPETLIVVQAFVVGSGLIPLYLVARRRVGADIPALLLASLYLLHPATQAAVLFDFHSIVLCAPLFLWAYWLAHTGRSICLAATVVLMLATQENAALVVAMLGLVLLLEGRRRPGSALVLAGLSWFAICFFLVLPSLNPHGSNAFGRYRHLGDTWLEVVRHLVSHPGVVLESFAGPQGRAYLQSVLLPFGYLSVLAPEILIGAASELGLNLLSAFPPQRAIDFQYASVPVAVGALAAVVGAARLANWLGRLGRFRRSSVATGLAACALVASLALQRFRYGLPPALANARTTYAFDSAHAQAGRALLRRLPPDVPVSA